MNERYAQQMMLPQIGSVGQAKIRATSVLVIGAGGLGCAVLPYLCGAGIGRIVLVDHDVVEVGNLHRQTLFGVNDVGEHKARAARDRLALLNPDCRVESVCERLTPANATALVNDCDVVVDCADSFAVTYTLSDACVAAGRPFVSASAAGLRGYAGAFCGGGPSYRALFPEIAAAAPSCAQTGVLGSVVGVIGSLQAHITLALILGTQPTPLGRLVSIDLAPLRFAEFSFSAATEPREHWLRFISESDLTRGDLVVDLRTEEEIRRSHFAGASHRSPRDVEQLASTLDPLTRVVLCCRSGVRAWHAARRLRAVGHDNVALIALGR